MKGEVKDGWPREGEVVREDEGDEVAKEGREMKGEEQAGEPELKRAEKQRKIERILPDLGERKWSGRKMLAGLLIISALVGVGMGVKVIASAVEAQRIEEARLEEERRIEEERQRQEAERIAAEERAREAERQRQERLKTGKVVVLTFDDGPSAATTNRLLDILKEKGVKVTFFLLGNMMQRVPDVAQRELREGHEVGSHTTAHVNFNRVNSAAEVQGEMAAMQGIFREVLGREFAIMRPPYGNGIHKAVVTQNVGVPMIHWAVDTLDWKSRDAAAVQAAALAGVYDGAIILMHDIYDSTVDAVPGMIDALRAAGYEFATISELAAARGVSMQAGQTYFYFKP